eukprot:scaffold42659_cov62-Phaeocystis_antarctica.AAC.7
MWMRPSSRLNRTSPFFRRLAKSLEAEVRAGLDRAGTVAVLRALLVKPGVIHGRHEGVALPATHALCEPTF